MVVCLSGSGTPPDAGETTRLVDRDGAAISDDDLALALLVSTGFLAENRDEQIRELAAALDHDVPGLGEHNVNRVAQWMAPCLTALATTIRRTRAAADHAHTGLDVAAQFLNVPTDPEPVAELAGAEPGTRRAAQRPVATIYRRRTTEQAGDQA